MLVQSGQLLAGLEILLRGPAAAEHTRPPPEDQIPLTRNEIAALFSTLITGPAKDARHRLRWSAWRRRHQRHRGEQLRQPGTRLGSFAHPGKSTHRPAARKTSKDEGFTP
jgi:ferric-dicitrate binding protein FerR (iron transport regulator)